MRKLSVLVVFLTTLLVFALVSTKFVSANENVNYDFFIGSGPIEEFGRVITMAGNGDTIEVRGNGTFSTKPKTVNGGGTFIHRDKNGHILGTGVWTATRLISFTSFGSGSVQGLPANFEGGQALMQIYIDPDARVPGFDGTIKISCELGHFPSWVHEGVRVAVRGVPINFNREKSGATLFVRKE